MKKILRKKEKRKLWPFILLLIAVLAGGFYYVKSSNSNMVQVPTVLNLSEEEAVKILEEKILKLIFLVMLKAITMKLEK